MLPGGADGGGVWEQEPEGAVREHTCGFCPHSGWFTSQEFPLQRVCIRTHSSICSLSVVCQKAPPSEIPSILTQLVEGNFHDVASQIRWKFLLVCRFPSIKLTKNGPEMFLTFHGNVVFLRKASQSSRAANLAAGISDFWLGVRPLIFRST